MTKIRAFAHAFLSTGLLFCAAQAFAEDQPAAAPGPDIAKGGAIAAQVCAACHGPDGNAISNAFPKLAAQHAGYLAKQLTNFKTGERTTQIMGPYAAALSDDDIQNVSAYFASKTEKPSVAHSADLAMLGRKIYSGGIAERGVPACASCHGPAGAGIPVQYPRVAGQWEEYAEAQLVAFKTGVRKNNAPMATIADRLSEHEIKAVSEYIAGLR